MTDPQKLAQQIALELDKRRTVDEKTHSEHHEFIRMKITQEKRRADLIETLKKNVLTWFLVGGLVGLFNLVLYWWENHPKGGPHG